MSAVVDTAAEITIIAQRVYDKMSPRPEISTSIDVNLAGGGATMAVGYLGECSYRNRGTQLRHLVYVAPLQDEMLLVQEHGVQLHCSIGEFRVGASLTIQPMFKANPNSLSCLSASRASTSLVSGGD